MKAHTHTQTYLYIYIYIYIYTHTYIYIYLNMCIYILYIYYKNMCVIYIHSSGTYSCKSTHHTIPFGKQTGFHPLVVKHSKGTSILIIFWIGNRDIIQTWRTFPVRLDGLKTYQHMSKCIAGTTRQRNWATSMMCSQCSNGWDILTHIHSLSCPKIPHSAWLQSHCAIFIFKQFHIVLP